MGVSERHEEVAAAPEAPLPPSILVAEDEPGVRGLLSKALATQGYGVTAACNGEEALAALGGQRFDIVLTDLNMPGLSGADLVAAIRAADPDVEVIVMSGNASLEAAVASVRHGAHDLIQKPFRVHDIVTAVGRALEKGRLRGMVSLFQATRAILGTVSREDLVPLILTLARRLFRTDAVSLAIGKPGAEDLRVSTAGNGPDLPSDPLVRELAQQAMGPFAPIAAEEGGLHVVATDGFGSVLVFPLVSREQVLGALALWRRAGESRFSITELRRASMLAAEAAIALHNATLYGELQQSMSELLAARGQLVQSEKLAATGRLAAGIAHEINTPTQFVGDSVSFLKEGFGDLLALVARYRALREAASLGSVVPEMIQEIARAEERSDLEYLTEQIPKAIERSLEGVSRIAEIVRAMKEFAHPDRKEKSPADLNRAILSTLTVAHNELKYVAEVETDLGDLPPVTCRLGDLNQVLLNLLVNAAHAIGDVVGSSGQKGKVTVRTRHERDEVVIQIADTGCGIPKEIRDKIFEQFFTTKEVGRGTGQGLAIARSIVVERHSGSISFDSEPGKGTTFTIRLPVDARQEAPAGAVP